MVYVNSIKITDTVIYMTVNDVFYNPHFVISPADATCPYVEWSTSHPDVVSVDPEFGNIRALKPGTAMVHATAADGGGASAYITVRVQEGAVTNINVIESHLVLPMNGSGQLHTELSPSTATNSDITWESTKPTVASVTNGVVSANSPGSTIIYARATGSYSIFDTCYVTVTSVENPVTSITLNHLYATKPVNTTFSLIATVTPSNATNNRIEWASSNPNVATVDQNGCVTTKREGGTTITASATDGSGVVAHCSVQVIPIPVTGIELSEEVIIKLGETKTLQATVLPADAANKTVTWYSCNEDIVYVNNGVINARGIGTTTIIAASVDGNYTASCTVKVVIEDVIIQPDGPIFNKVYFVDSDKTWYCINADMIYDDNNMSSSVLKSRVEANYFVYPKPEPPYTRDETPKIYSDEEIKLLYAIDPFGVSVYVKDFALSKSSLEDGLIYKDHIFEIIVGRKPKYYARSLLVESRWYETTDIDVLRKVVSESEILFGSHPIYDGVTLFEGIGLLLDIAGMILGGISPDEKTVAEVLHKIATISVTTLSAGDAFISDEIVSFAAGTSFSISTEFDEDLKNTNVAWPLDLIGVFESLNEFMASIIDKPGFLPNIIDYCACKSDYQVFIESTTGETVSLESICTH